MDFLYLFGATLVFAAIIWYEVPPLLKKKMRGELIAFSVLMVLAMVMGYAQILEIKLPNPTKLLQFIFSPVVSLLEKALKS